MIILALDMANDCGWAWGSAGQPPASGVWTLRRKNAPMDEEPGALIRNVLKLIADTGGRKPDLVAVEQALNPAAKWQPTDSGKQYAMSQSIRSQERLHGAILAWTGISGVPYVSVPASSARALVCGRASATPPNITWRKITSEDRRKATKDMVLRTMILLKLVPIGTTDTNQSDAACVWAWAERTQTRALELSL